MVFVISNIHTCHQIKFDLGRSSTRYPSGLHKKIDTWYRDRGPVKVGQLMFSRENLRRICYGHVLSDEYRAHSTYKHNSQAYMPADITLKENVCVCVFFLFIFVFN